MFVGMEHIMLSNNAMADEALNASNHICNGDPLLVNERGVMAFNHGEFVFIASMTTSRWFIVCFSSYKRAATLFQESLDLAEVTQSSQKSWATTYLNLGTCYRKLKWASSWGICGSNLRTLIMLPQTLRASQASVSTSVRNRTPSFTSISFLGHDIPITRRYRCSHSEVPWSQCFFLFTRSLPQCWYIVQALSVDPINGHVIELLNLALESNTSKGPAGLDRFPGGAQNFKELVLAARAKLKQGVAIQSARSREQSGFRSDDEMNVGWVNIRNSSPFAICDVGL